MTIAANGWTSLTHMAPTQSPYMTGHTITCTFSHINHGSATTIMEL